MMRLKELRYVTSGSTANVVSGGKEQARWDERALEGVWQQRSGKVRLGPLTRSYSCLCRLKLRLLGKARVARVRVIASPCITLGGAKCPKTLLRPDHHHRYCYHHLLLPPPPF